MAPLMKVRRYDTDPSTPARGPVFNGSIFDQDRARNLDMPDSLWEIFSHELEHPNDPLLIATLVAHGHPLEHADQLRYHPKARMGAYRFWINVQEAAKGDKNSQEWVDRAREAWEKQRGPALEQHTFGRPA